MASLGKMETNSAPWNFSWIVENELAAMACPHTPDNLRFLMDQDITYLISLSPETKPPIHTFPDIHWTVIPIEEFCPPSIYQIKKFIDICQKCKTAGKRVGIHCRMGRGRTGVMAACYLVHFYQQSPERAITNIRLMRPGSVETYEQERVVIAYNDYLRANQSSANVDVS